MEFTQNYWGQSDIITKTKILTKRGTDTIYAVILKNIRSIPQPQYLKMRIFLAGVNKFP